MRPCLARRLIALASAWASSRVTRPLAGGPLGGSSAHGGLYFGLAGRVYRCRSLSGGIWWHYGRLYERFGELRATRALARAWVPASASVRVVHLGGL